MRRIIFAGALTGILGVPAVGQGVDPLIGTWKLNLEKSTFTGLAPPKSRTATFAGEGQTFAVTVEGVEATGQAFKVVFRHIYDGMPHPTTGSPDYDSTSYTRIGNTVNVVFFKNGKPVQVGQGVIVPGKTWTLTEEGIDLNNQPFRDVAVYDRQ